MADTASLLVCRTCGTQHSTSDPASLATCFICDDPRQYTPPTGQEFTTLSALRTSKTHRNEFHPYPPNSKHPLFTSIVTTPKIAIGQRAILLHTPKGNILWDCITYLDDETTDKIINELGGLEAIVISHPHFYSAHLEWAERFGCPVYLSAEDQGWLARRDGKRQVFLREIETRIEVGGEDTGVRAIKLGGHFPGSLVLLYDGHLLTADTLMMTPSGRANWNVDALGRPRERPGGMSTFCFMWSIPNMIPLSPDEIAPMWGILKNYNMRSAHGLFLGWDIEDERIKERVLESMQIQVRAMGHETHSLLNEVV
ncbi:Metallo-beta-lactamase domain protein, putative [Madurella fahalii]|uniref:Metallo-beta-lactamase domain protein, putative n=1 Tax=Madurella fahalii TaxID=1157608 RepID=A0ABQ0FXK4_9PEZI